MSTQTAVSRVFNFSAGPAVLPLSVLQQIQDEIVSLPGVGSSVLEISHRSKTFVDILEDARSRLIAILEIPENYEVLFLQGGARLQNAMVPMNLLTDSSQTADYIVSGNWGKTAVSKFRDLENSMSPGMDPVLILTGCLSSRKSTLPTTPSTCTTHQTKRYTGFNSNSPRSMETCRLPVTIHPIFFVDRWMFPDLA